VSQCAAILRVLRDGKPHTVSEIHERAGFSRLNSRVSDLRGQGHDIRCSTVDGTRASERYVYQLLSSSASEPVWAGSLLGATSADTPESEADSSFLSSAPAVGDGAVSSSAVAIGELERAGADSFSRLLSPKTEVAATAATPVDPFTGVAAQQRQTSLFGEWEDQAA
jgi:hypothetical protein